MTATTKYITNFYIDGFNLYHGIKDTNRHDLLWIDLGKLTQIITGYDRVINRIKYFTALPIHRPNALAKHTTWIRAIGAMSMPIEIIYGRYHLPPAPPIEKMTDVNIAVEMIMDAIDPNDAANEFYLISADSDLLPAIKALKRIPKNPRTVIAFPPKRYSKDLRNLTRSKQININDLVHAKLPNSIALSDGSIIIKPSNWQNQA